MNKYTLAALSPSVYDVCAFKQGHIPYLRFLSNYLHEAARADAMSVSINQTFVEHRSDRSLFIVKFPS